MSLPGAAGTVKEYPSYKISPTARKPRKAPLQPEKGRKIKNVFLTKSAIFQSLMRGTAKQHGSLHIGAHLVAKGMLGLMRQIHPISTCIEGESAIFFEVRVFRRTQVGFGVAGPHNTTGDLRNTPGTPAIHFPLAAAGSHSALYHSADSAKGNLHYQDCMMGLRSWSEEALYPIHQNPLRSHSQELQLPRGVDKHLSTLSVGSGMARTRSPRVPDLPTNQPHKRRSPPASAASHTDHLS